MERFSRGRVVAASVVAVLCGFTFPVTFLTISGAAALTVVTAVLYAWAGLIPVGVIALTATLTAGFISVAMGSFLPLMLGLCCAILPGLYVVWLLWRRGSFFAGLSRAIVGQLLGMAAALVLARWATGRDLVDVIVDEMRAIFAQMPVLQARTLLKSMSDIGMRSVLGDVASPLMSMQRQSAMIENLCAWLSSLLRGNMVSALLNSGVVCGLLAYALPARMMVRRGAEPPIQYVHLHDWRLPKSMVIGMPVCTLAAAVMALGLRIPAARPVYVAFFNLFCLAFAIQGMAWVSRRMRAGGMPSGRRTALCIGLYIFAQTLLIICGLLSAFFGAEGVITEFMRKHNKNTPGGDDWS